MDVERAVARSPINVNAELTHAGYIGVRVGREIDGCRRDSRDLPVVKIDGLIF